VDVTEGCIFFIDDMQLYGKWCSHGTEKSCLTSLACLSAVNSIVETYIWHKLLMWTSVMVVSHVIVFAVMKGKMGRSTSESTRHEWSGSVQSSEDWEIQTYVCNSLPSCSFTCLSTAYSVCCWHIFLCQWDLWECLTKSLSMRPVVAAFTYCNRCVTVKRVSCIGLCKLCFFIYQIWMISFLKTIRSLFVKRCNLVCSVL